MARRKGWNELSDAYRRRLERSGVSKTDYESGTSLKSARGHKTPTGIGEKTYQSLRRLASGLPWEGQKPKEVIDEALQRGESPDWIKERLSQKRKDIAAYKKGDRTKGRENWERRRLTVPRHWYWYHP